jgi:hypothetical protein
MFIQSRIIPDSARWFFTAVPWDIGRTFSGKSWHAF